MTFLNLKNAILMPQIRFRLKFWLKLGLGLIDKQLGNKRVTGNVRT